MKTFRVISLLPLLLLLTLPATVNAQYTCLTNNGTLTIVLYTGPGGEVAVPGTIAGLPVVSIGDYAFEDRADLTGVTLPDSVTSIGTETFCRCSNLTRVTLPSSVTVLGAYSFSRCASLARIALPNNLTSIGDWAFSLCTNLTSITIPDSVTSIGERAFYRCYKLTSVTIPPAVRSIADGTFVFCTNMVSLTAAPLNPYFSSVDGVLYNSDLTTLVQYPVGRKGLYTVPNGVTSIQGGAFAGCCGLTSVILPASVSDLGELAFYSCTNLMLAWFQGNAPRVQSDTFDGDSYLTIYYRAANSGWGSTFGGRPTAAWNPNVPYVYAVNNGAITIRRYVGFGGELILPRNINSVPVTSIADGAFSGYDSVTSVTLCKNITSIAAGAFGSGRNLSAIGVDPLNSNYSSVDGVLFNRSQTTLLRYPTGRAGSYTIPNGVTTIADGAFDACTLLTSVVIPASVSTMGSAPFRQCTSLTTITADPLNPSYSSVDGVLFNKNLTTLIQYPPGRQGRYSVPGGVTSIEEAAFGSCSGLTSVSLPASLTGVADWAFYYCPNLTEAFFEGTAPSIGVWSFQGADNLTVYYASGTGGWGPTYGSHPTALSNPALSISPALDLSVPPATQGFRFDASHLITGRTYELQSTADLTTWTPVRTFSAPQATWTLTNQWQAANSSIRLFRLRLVP